MRIIALEKEVPGITDDMFTSDILRAEAKRALELYQSGKIRELYFRHDRQEAVLILECNDADEAKSVLATLPLVRKGLIAFEVIPLIAYPGFSRLIENQKH